MRITKKERKKNAEQFYNMFMSGCCNKTAIVAQKCVSTNPNVNKVHFMAVPSSISYGTPVVIAESNLGLTGCFTELLQNIHPEIVQEKSYFDDGFKIPLSVAECLLKIFSTEKQAVLINISYFL